MFGYQLYVNNWYLGRYDPISCRPSLRGDACLQTHGSRIPFISTLGIPAGVPERAGASASTRGSCEAPEPFNRRSLRPRCGQDLTAKTFPAPSAGTSTAALPPQLPLCPMRLRIIPGVLDPPPAGATHHPRDQETRAVRLRRGAYESGAVLTEKRSTSVAAMAGDGAAPAAGALLTLPAASRYG